MRARIKRARLRHEWQARVGVVGTVCVRCGVRRQSSGSPVSPVFGGAWKTTYYRGEEKLAARPPCLPDRQLELFSEAADDGVER